MSDYYPPFSELMDISDIDSFITAEGVRLGWMRGHACPCSMSGDNHGTPRPNCQTCHGRGTYWDNPSDFVGFITYMHTSSAPDEPGGIMHSEFGNIGRAEPTLTIPSVAGAVWSDSGEFDAYVEYDALTRRQTAKIVGESPTLPYSFNISVNSVTTYNETTNLVEVVPPSVNSSKGYVLANKGVTLIGYDPGSAFTVDYKASPIYVAHRRSGGLSHKRPFGLGATLPVRYHIIDMDLFLRAANSTDGPQTQGY